MFPAWFMGKDPYRQTILAGASTEFAESEFGRKIKAIVQGPAYQQVFPLASLDGGSKAVGNLVFAEGGSIKSIGKGAQVVGRGADLLVIDDPYSGAEEAHSATEREKLWTWFTSDAISRLMPGGRVIIIHQRWHEDDLTGRLLDPDHPEHDAKQAAKWTHINLPAVVKSQRLAEALNLKLEVPKDPDVISEFGDEPLSALWPNRYSPRNFAEIHNLNPQAFTALYMGSPTLEEGDFFKREWLKTYMPNQLPKNLRYYCASDHAVSTDTAADFTCLVPVGVDEQDDIWVLPDVWWRQAPSDVTSDAMLAMMQQFAPLFWWAEKGHISKSIGPFLRKRMQEEKCYINLIEVTPAKDKMTRAQSINGRMAMGKVHFPSFAPWWKKAQDELLKFPNARHDDFVDALAYIGLGLSIQVRADQAKKPEAKWPRTGTMEWVKFSSRYQERQAKNKQEAWN
jgi:predicted phage terminase large subunit-like protein